MVYRGLWCDTMTPGGCDASGTTKWQGDNLVGTMEGDMNGQKMVTRFIYSDWKPNSFMMTMETGPDVNSMKEAMTITYARAGGGKSEKWTSGESKLIFRRTDIPPASSSSRRRCDRVPRA